MDESKKNDVNAALRLVVFFCKNNLTVNDCEIFQTLCENIKINCLVKHILN